MPSFMCSRLFSSVFFFSHVTPMLNFNFVPSSKVGMILLVNLPKLSKCFSLYISAIETFKTTVRRLLANSSRYIRRNQDSDPVNDINASQLGKILNHKELCKCLFPENRVVVDFVPYRLMTENADLIKTERTTIYLSRGDGRAEKALLTFGTLYYVSIGVVYNMEIYGCLINLATHIREHVTRVTETAINSNDVLFRCYCRPEMDMDNVVETMCKFGCFVPKNDTPGILCTEIIPNEADSLSRL